MPVHLPGENNISFEEDDDITDIASQEFRRRTMLTEWFRANQEYAGGRDLTYCEYPSRFKWDGSGRTWLPRRGPNQVGSGKIGRLYYVHPSVGERYFLRMLLLVVRGAVSYEDVRRYNGVLYSTFKGACNTRGLLGDDQEWYDAFDEAAAWATSPQLRQLFVTMLLFYEINDEYAFFEKVWRLLADDVQYRFRESIGNSQYHVSDSELSNFLIDDLSALFAAKGARIRDHHLPCKSGEPELCLGNRLIEEELSYDASCLLSEADSLVEKLTAEQLAAFRSITCAVLAGRLDFFFISGYGGIGKTFLWGAIVTWLRARGKIVLTVASSGVASLLLPRGRTAHSRFKIPCDIDVDAMCDIKRGTMLAGLIENTSLVIWDEALMTHRHAFETLDRTFRDIMSRENDDASSQVFGGKVVVLGGDLRQILPIVEGGDRSQIVDVAIVNSHLWAHVTVLTLSINMRLRSPDLDEKAQQELTEFSRWVLDVGNGKIDAVKREGESEATWIKVPRDLLLMPTGDNVSSIVDVAYPDMATKFLDPQYLRARAILTPTNEDADAINSYITSLIFAEDREYLSCDKISKS
jgi:hypothetical protein